jgi:O-antigen ligase
MLMVWGGWSFVQAVRGRLGFTEPSHIVGAVLAAAVLLLLVIGFGGLDVAWRRWSEIEQQLTLQNSRLLVAGVCIDMLPNSGWFGFGPGSFHTAFPFFNKHTGPETRGVWLYAHQDYLQTLVEWGWMGAVLWMVVFAGAAYALSCVVRKAHRFAERDRLFVLASGCGLGAVLVHALADFPLQIASIQLYLAVLVGVLWSCRWWDVKRHPLSELQSGCNLRSRYAHLA